MVIDLNRLQRFPLLQDFSDAELRELFATANEQRFVAETFVCREDEPGGVLYLVVSGQVEISKKGKNGTPYVITRLNGGTLLGELSWITGASYSASVRAKQATEVICLEGAELTRQLQKNSIGAQKFHVAVLKLLAGRLTRMNEQALELQVNLDDQKTGEIERLRERILRDWSF